MSWIDTAPGWLRTLIACPCMLLIVVGAIAFVHYVIGPEGDER